MKTIIGKIYANWCGHCQSLKPEWYNMKKMLKYKNKNIQFIEIEESQQEKLNKFKKRFPQLEINGYPTIFKITANKSIEYYTGNRISNDMKKWATEKSTTRSTKKRFTQTNHNKTKRFFGFFDDNK
jgi:thiol-disulfide isomerase/thioredoxin